jgi:hypothetical protein
MSTMSGPIFRFLAADHARLDGLLQRAATDPDHIDLRLYSEFRAGLLKHIGMEEKVLLPTAQRARGDEPLPIAAKLRLDHGAIAALLVPTPTPAIVSALRSILAAHNEIEEGPNGLYETCDQLLGAESGAVLDRLRRYPEVPLAPHNDEPRVMEATRRALMRAGYRVQADMFAAGTRPNEDA